MDHSSNIIAAATGIYTILMTEICSEVEEEIVAFEHLKTCLVTKSKLSEGLVTPEFIKDLVSAMRDLIVCGSPNSEITCTAAGDLNIRGFQELRIRAHAWRQTRDRIVESEKKVQMIREQIRKRVAEFDKAVKIENI